MLVTRRYRERTKLKGAGWDQKRNLQGFDNLLSFLGLLRPYSQKRLMRAKAANIYVHIVAFLWPSYLILL